MMKRLPLTFLYVSFLMFFFFSSYAQNTYNRGVSFLFGIHSAEKLDIQREYAIREDVALSTKRSFGVEGQLRYRYFLNENTAIVLGLGLGAYSYHLTLFASEEFIGIPELSVQYGQAQFTSGHVLGTIGGETFASLSNKLKIGLGAAIQYGVFIQADYSLIYNAIDRDIGLVPVFQTEYFYNPKQKFFVGLKFNPGIRWDVSERFNIYASLGVLLSRFKPIENALYTIEGADPTSFLAGRINHKYSYVGLDIETVYRF